MTPDDSQKNINDQERDRATKLSQLYPQPTEYSDSFTHTPQVTNTTVPTEQSDINLVRLSLVGATISLPFIAFEVGRSMLADTKTVTEASQLGMLSLLYLLFVAGLTLLTYKLFIKNNRVTSLNPFFAYCTILLFSIPTTLILKSLFLHEASTVFTATIYYAVIGITFAAATLSFAKLNRRGGLLLLIAPYVIGTAHAIFGIVR